MARILLVRHGNTELNSSQRYWGRNDVKLSADGLRQAERLCERLAMERIDTIYSSDLRRASVTAKIIASRHQPGVITCAELREVNFGQLEGLTFGEISQLYPEVAKLWVERSSELEYPGGESLAELNNRVGNFLGRLEKLAEEETVLIVSHSGVLRTLICQLLGLELRFRWQLRLDFASLSIIDTYQGGAILQLLNDVSHLAEKDF